MRSTCPILISLALLFLAPLLSTRRSLVDAQQTANATAGKDEQGHIKSAEGPCAACHEEIVRSYSETAMAQASGPALEALIPGEFQHRPSGVRYRIYEENGKAWLSFERDGADSLKGTRELLYFIGSGHRGRTYLFVEDGFAFESPVNWYAQAKTWDMTPAYRSATQIPLNLPTVASCLHCHTSRFHAPFPGTENKYPKPLFAQNGITCERCHGSAAAHASTGEKMMKLATLPPARRDAICMQCHLEGNAAIEQSGKHLYDYKPGDDLGEYVHYLVLVGGRKSNPRAVSQFEALAESACKRKSGDALHCTTCHDPHRSPHPEERVEYYRSRCLKCHGEKLGKTHHARTPDCTSCHMPRVVSSDVAHTEATDHRILRQPQADIASSSPSERTQPKLIRFPQNAGPATERDLALGWLALAEAENTSADAQEENILPEASKQYPHDAAILSAYAYRELQHNRVQSAKELYEAALASDPLNADAAVNLGVIDVQRGAIEKAKTLWQGAFERVPWRNAVGMNLARLSCNLGQRKDAETYLRRVLQFNPDLADARTMLRQLESQSELCGLSR
jgi:predicted CXXCH cytochrome family protein